MLKVKDFQTIKRNGKVKSIQYNKFYYNFKLNGGHVTIDNIKIMFNDCFIGLGVNGVIHLDNNMVFNDNHKYNKLHDFVTRVEEYKQGLYGKIYKGV